MRFPSIAMVVGEAGRTFRRFPLVAVSALLAAAAAVAMVEEPEQTQRFLRLLATASLGLPLFTALALVVERGRPGGKADGAPVFRPWPTPVAAILQLAGVAVLAAVYVAWPHWHDQLAVRRYLQLSLAFHLLVAFLPFAAPGERNGFWQFNKTLFIRFLIAALYAHVLFAGLSVAILALDKLFGVNVAEERYLELWILIGFVFTTTFFLGGVPRDLSGLDAVTDYPRGLRVFSQFILAPLVTVYLVILTLYLGKVAITRVWPSGWIGYLVSSVSVAGILSLLLVAPVRERAENAWIATFSRWFYLVLLPSVAMMLLAVWKRVDQYGVTENRYFLIVLSVWLAVVAVYFTFRRWGSIKIIPGSLCAVALITLGGPWGAYQVSARSQTHRLAGILERNGMLVDGRVRAAAAPDSVSLDDQREMTAIFTYLLETHGTGPVAGWFKDGLAGVDTVGGEARRGDGWRARRQTERILDDLGVPYAEAWERPGRRAFFHLEAPSAETVLPLEGYDYYVHVGGVDMPPVEVGGHTLRVDYEIGSISLRVREGDQVLVRVPLGGLIEKARTGPRPRRAEGESGSVWTMTAENDRVAVLLAVRGMRGRWEGESPRLTSLTGELLLRFKP